MREPVSWMIRGGEDNVGTTTPHRKRGWWGILDAFCVAICKRKNSQKTACKNGNRIPAIAQGLQLKTAAHTQQSLCDAEQTAATS